MSDIRTKDLVADYVNHRLQREGLSWPDPSPNLPPPCDVHLTMRALGDEVENRFTGDIVNRIAIRQGDDATRALTEVAEELFRVGDIKWGRIVTLISYTGCMCVRAMGLEMPALVDKYVDCIAEYIDTNLHQWIIEHNGWPGFVLFYQQGVDFNESQWPTMKQVLTYSVGAIGVMTLGAILANKS